MIEVVNDDGTSSDLVPYENIQSENGIWIVGKMLHDFEGNDEEKYSNSETRSSYIDTNVNIGKRRGYIKCLE